MAHKSVHDVVALNNYELIRSNPIIKASKQFRADKLGKKILRPAPCELLLIIKSVYNYCQIIAIFVLGVYFC